MRRPSIALLLVLSMSCSVAFQDSVRSSGTQCSTSRFWWVSDLLIAGTFAALVANIDGPPESYIPAGVFVGSGLIGIYKRGNCVRYRETAPPEAWARDAERARVKDEQQAAAMRDLRQSMTEPPPPSPSPPPASTGDYQPAPTYGTSPPPSRKCHGHVRAPRCGRRGRQELQLGQQHRPRATDRRNLPVRRGVLPGPLHHVVRQRRRVPVGAQLRLDRRQDQDAGLSLERDERRETPAARNTGRARYGHIRGSTWRLPPFMVTSLSASGVTSGSAAAASIDSGAARPSNGVPGVVSIRIWRRIPPPMS